MAAKKTTKATTSKSQGSPSSAARTARTKSAAAKRSASKKRAGTQEAIATKTGNTKTKAAGKRGLGAGVAKKSQGGAAAARTAGKAPRAGKVKGKTPEPVTLVDKDTAAQEMELLVKRWPDAHCELDYTNDFELLTAVILSAQTTDVTVNKVTPRLFKRFPTPKALAEASVEEVKEIIRPTGYYNAKAKSIQACARALVEKFGGRCPTTLKELTELPGVGRKTANVVLGEAHGIPGWAVDTHVQRLSRRLGFTTQTDPAKIEQDLIKLFPGQAWDRYSITLIWHGRRTCYARQPDCAHCPVNHLCPSSLV